MKVALEAALARAELAEEAQQQAALSVAAVEKVAPNIVVDAEEILTKTEAELFVAKAKAEVRAAESALADIEGVQGQRDAAAGVAGLAVLVACFLATGPAAICG